ncbi:sensor histidine kinase KdpD [Leptolyngbya sp. FACHB-261]|uniref:sensor histidine kinase n=1 Tax=Leptolyngbya sp. FACHB-261 TaxID=2692806 RepID=UPI001684367C|nr:HAMP domain-containing sensor histidine kinase [Leptolyngbya sp. FACHB-261]MBD2100470.1 HAMP domain-containing histidine kinase [Leptolyngbya sp. FACHB-261]
MPCCDAVPAFARSALAQLNALWSIEAFWISQQDRQVHPGQQALADAFPEAVSVINGLLETALQQPGQACTGRLSHYQSGQTHYRDWAVQFQAYGPEATDAAMASCCLELAGWLVTVRDVTDWVAAQTALEEKHTKLMAANKQIWQLNQRSQSFLGGIGHDLKNPISANLMLAKMLTRSSHQADKVEQYAWMIIDNCYQQGLLVDNLQQYAQLQAGAYSLKLQPCNLALSLQHIVATCNPLAAQRQIRIEVQAAANLPLVWADAGALERVLGNLLGNALKFSPDGSTVSIALNTGTLPDDGTGITELHACCCVSDSGPGIEATDLPRIFDRFYRAQSNRVIPGSGIGLAVVRELVELMQGVIAVKSNPGDGSQFSIYLRTAEATTNPALMPQ